MLMKRLLPAAASASALCVAALMLAGTAFAQGAPSAARGKELFEESCSTCHGMQGQGVPHLGVDLQTSKFVAQQSDAQLVAFITQGRAANDPHNTTHVAMPPKGGNPSLNPQNLADIVAYMRQLQKTHPGAAAHHAPAHHDTH